MSGPFTDSRIDPSHQDWPGLRPIALEEGRTAQAQVYEALRKMLMSGQLRPGEEISLRHAAGVLGTSVTPVREALRQLEIEGGLEVHGGNRVCRVPVITPEELSEIREIRVQLEGMATEAAADLMTGSQMRRVTNACHLMQRATETGDAELYLENNWRFHALIYDAARRPTLLGMIERLWLRTGPLVRLALNKPKHVEHSMACHHEAEAALRAKDARSARDAIIRDISDAARDLDEILVAPETSRRRKK